MHPAELAQPFAFKLIKDGLIPGSDDDTFKIDRLDLLDELARELRVMPRSYLVHADRALVLPRSGAFRYESTELNDPVFEGELAGYTTIDSPRALGRDAINAVCLAFDAVTMFESIGDDCSGIVYVPVFPLPAIERVNV